MKILLATANRGKIAELRALLADLDWEIVGLDQLPQRLDVEENGATFLDNALLKARAYAQLAGLPTIADDSGLCVEALGGRPGVHSARYAGLGANDAANNARLLREMATHTDRRAKFVCVSVCVLPTGETIEATGECVGEILSEPRGTAGFGYDPLFFHPPSGKTFAQLSAAEKNRISHRALSLGSLKAKMAASPAFAPRAK
ncbi:MAG TPA: XTP/dITP diphosphatase [bacterium]|nr:XTP/dITP diphosphatase [bacterium]